VLNKEKLSYTFLIFVMAGLLGFTAISGVRKQESSSIVKYVSPLIGTSSSTTLSAAKNGSGSENNAQVIPEVTVPFGMTNWTPQTRNTEEKCIAPYYYDDTVITGFRGSHWLSGSCTQDYGTVSIMPTSGKLKCLPSERGSKFSHSDEKAAPYYYKILLKDYNVLSEMTATTRAGILRFTFLKKGEEHIIINPNSDYGEGFIKIIPDKNEVIGYNPVHRIYQGWGKEAGFKGYFAAKFSKPFKSFGVYRDSNIYKGQTEISDKKNIGAFVSYNSENKNDTVIVKIGTSFTSIKEAEENLNAEIKHFDFISVKERLYDKWNNLFSRIEVYGKNENDKTKFYTALYHCFLQPRIFNDVDGSYPEFDGGKKILKVNNGNYYCDFSMWDTYRALHPLFNLIIPKINSDMMKSLLLKGEEGGWMPIYPCWNSYTSEMIGDHAVAAIAEAYDKGVINLSNEDYQLLLKNAMKSPEDSTDYINGKGRRALKSYLKYGYIPLEDSIKYAFHKGEQVSRTLEYAYDDFSLSLAAKKMGDYSDYNILSKRAMNYKNVFDKDVECVRGRYENGKWTNNFDKLKRMPYITEGTPWQYTWYVPQDIAELIKLMEGEKEFNKNLDDFFAAGQYWHGNETDQQVPFLYNYSGQPWKTQKIVTGIMNEEYGLGPGGLSGNDDGGQMSAWYVLAALGFYPVCPSKPQYVISGPHFDKIIIQLDGNKTLIITANGASIGMNYINSITINGKIYDKNYFSYFDLMRGGNIKFSMTKTPNRNWGKSISDTPGSLSN
jgi:predicted alpha-1,2-mannosidase